MPTEFFMLHHLTVPHASMHYIKIPILDNLWFLFIDVAGTGATVFLVKLPGEQFGFANRADELVFL